MLHNVRQEFMVNNYTVNETLQPCLSQNDCLLFLPIALLMIKTCVLSVTYTTRRRLRLHVEEGLNTTRYSFVCRNARKEKRKMYTMMFCFICHCTYDKTKQTTTILSQHVARQMILVVFLRTTKPLNNTTRRVWSQQSDIS